MYLICEFLTGPNKSASSLKLVLDMDPALKKSPILQRFLKYSLKISPGSA